MFFSVFYFFSVHSTIKPPLSTIMVENQRRLRDMRDKKYYIALDDFERRVVVNCLNEMRNNLIANSKYTDAVDERSY